MKKKLLALLCAATLAFSLAACGGTDESGNTSKSAENAGEGTVQTETETETADAAETEVAEVYPAGDPVLIGVELYNPTESETIAMQEYFGYLEENMNVKFKYSEAISNADDEFNFIDDCAIAGCKGFIARYNVSGIEQVNKVMEYGMYYWGMAENPEVYEAVKNEELYVGSVHTGNDDYNRGKALAQWVIDEGFTKVVYASGGADFGVEMFVNRQAGFKDGLEGQDVEVITVSGFPGDQFYAAQNSALSEDGLQAVCASFNGVNFWAQPIDTAGLKDTVKLATIGSVNQECIDAFSSGALSFLSSDDYQRYGLAVGALCNAIDGNGDALREDGAAINETIKTWTMTTAEEAQKYVDILSGEKVFDAQEIMSICKTVNPDASIETLRALIESASSEALLGE